VLAGVRGEVAILVVFVVKILRLLAHVMAVGVIDSEVVLSFEWWLLAQMMVTVVVDYEEVAMKMAGC
jgi:hypothetical protein